MKNSENILSLALQQPIMSDDLRLVQQRTSNIPGTVKYTMSRYRKPLQTVLEDTGMFVYTYHENKETEAGLDLIFCMSGNTYCKRDDHECNLCKHAASAGCEEKVDTIDLASFRFSSDHLNQFLSGIKTSSFSEKVLNFSHTSSFTKTLPICSRTRSVLDALLNHKYTDSFENIFINAQTQMLLLYSMECMAGDGEETFSCKFLANEADREKISLAREILLQHISEPLTIKELSRKAAINECYLKKGFKEMYGITVFDFFQSQRMEHAKYLLYEKGLSVTDVSALLGYSSISHFSTAFKKHTGLKPCELLLR